MIKWLNKLWFKIQFKFTKVYLSIDVESGDDIHWVATKKVRGCIHVIDQGKWSPKNDEYY